MSDPRIIVAMRALVERLEGITQAAGYHTDLGGRVHDGWPRGALARVQEPLPLLAVHPDTDDAQEAHGSHIKASREAALELIVDPHEHDREWLDYALHDVRRALVGLHDDQPGVITATTGAARFAELEDSTVVRLIIPVTISYSDHYGA